MTASRLLKGVAGVGGLDAFHVEPFHVVLGFAPSRYGLSILGRASQKQVVNVAQRGGLCAVMTGHPQRPREEAMMPAQRVDLSPAAQDGQPSGVL